jgi:urease beta subunit
MPPYVHPPTCTWVKGDDRFCVQNIPAGTAVRFEPGESKTVNLVAIGGNK